MRLGILVVFTFALLVGLEAFRLRDIKPLTENWRAGFRGSWKEKSQQVREKLKSSKIKWKSGPTKFDDWSLQSIVTLMGTKLEMMKANKNGIEVLTRTVDLSKIPAQFDARTRWSNCPTISQIRDQGNCGSCWAVSTAEAISDRLCIASNGKTTVEISAQDLLACCNSCGFGCQGGFPDKAWQFFVNEGLVTGGEFRSKIGCVPYSIGECKSRVFFKSLSGGCDWQFTPMCSRECRSSYDNTYFQDKYYGESSYMIPKDPAQIQYEIMTNGPVGAAFTVYADFMAYSGGVYSHVTGESLGGHAVKIVGWGVDNGTAYWNIANSWGTDWGENGYFRIVRGDNECGIEDFITAGITKVYT